MANPSNKAGKSADRTMTAYARRLLIQLNESGMSYDKIADVLVADAQARGMLKPDEKVSKTFLLDIKNHFDGAGDKAERLIAARFHGGSIDATRAAAKEYWARAGEEEWRASRPNAETVVVPDHQDETLVAFVKAHPELLHVEVLALESVSQARKPGALTDWADELRKHRARGKGKSDADSARSPEEVDAEELAAAEANKKPKPPTKPKGKRLGKR